MQWVGIPPESGETSSSIFSVKQAQHVHTVMRTNFDGVYTFQLDVVNIQFTHHEIMSMSRKKRKLEFEGCN